MTYREMISMSSGQREAGGIDSLIRRATSVAWCAVVAGTLSACASSVISNPKLVLDNIQREIAEGTKPAEPKSTSTSATNNAIEQSLLPPLQLDSAKSASPARFDISVSNAPAAQVFMAIVEGTPYSVLVPPEVTGTLTLSLKAVTVREVLDTIRDLYGYGYRVDGTRIFVEPNTMQTRMFTVNYLAGKRQGSTNITLSSNSMTSSGTTGGTSGTTTTPTVSSPVTAPGGTPGVVGSGGGAQITTTQDSDFWGNIQTALDAIVGRVDGRNVVLNRSSGVILIRAMPSELRNVEKYLRTTQLVVERQVMLEAKIIDVALNDEYQAGVNWAYYGGSDNRWVTGGVERNSTIGGSGASSIGNNIAALPGKAIGAIATGLSNGLYGLAFQSNNFAAMLRFLESQGTVHVLSSPRVATLNNQKAVLKVGNDEFYVTNVSTTTTSGTGATTTSPTVTLQPFFSGITLDVTPQIDDSDQIILHVHPSISKVSEKTKTIDLGSGGLLILPLASSNVNESDSIVRVSDGQIVAIGGLMAQRQINDTSGLPGTTSSDVNLLGARGRSLTKAELVILIKPTIIREDADWRANLIEAQTRLQEYAPPTSVHIQGK